MEWLLLDLTDAAHALIGECVYIRAPIDADESGGSLVLHPALTIPTCDGEDVVHGIG